MEVFIHKQIESLDEILPKWIELRENYKEITIFQEIEWMKSWWNRKKRDKKITPYIVEIKKKDETLGIIPLYISEKAFLNVQFHILRPIGIVEANSLIPILSKKYSSKQLLKKAMEKIYADKEHWDCIHWGDLPEYSDFDLFYNDMEKERNKLVYRRRSELSASILLDENIETVMSKVNKRLLKDVLYDDRRLKREGDLQFHKVENENDIEPIMNIFFDLHRTRWKKTRTPSVFENEADREYNLQLAKSLFSNNLLYLVYLTHNDDVLVVNFGMADGKTNWLYMHATNMNYRKFSVGHLLAYYIIQDSCKENYRVIDYLRGNIEYKKRWGTVNTYNLEYWLFNTSLQSLLFRLINRTYYSKEFLKRPLIKQIPVKLFIRGCVFILGVKNKFKFGNKVTSHTFNRSQNRA